MKKLLILALATFVSACACFDCEDEPVPTTYQTTRNAKMDCDYFDGKTCYRYVYNTVQRPVAQPAPIRYRPCNTYQPAPQPAPCQCAQPATSCGSCNPCAAKISETREPVEVIYKKTTYKTVYEPKTFSQVSYEKAPYSSVSAPEQVEVVDNEQVILQEVK